MRGRILGGECDDVRVLPLRVSACVRVSLCVSVCLCVYVCVSVFLACLQSAYVFKYSMYTLYGCDVSAVYPAETHRRPTRLSEDYLPA